MSDEPMTHDTPEDDLSAIKASGQESTAGLSTDEDPPIVRYGSIEPSVYLESNPDEMESVRSFAAVLALASLTFITAIGLGLAMELMDEWNIRPRPFVRFCLIIQTVFFPPVVCFCFTTTTLLFWYGPISLRFLAACFSVLPGVVAFCGVCSFFNSGPPNLWTDVNVVMTAMLLASTLVALMVQLWSRWTLTHDRKHTAAPPTGIQSIIELTVIGALASLVGTVVDFSTYWIGIAFFASFGVGGTVAVIACQIAYLRHERSSAMPYVIGGFAVFACSYGVNTFFAYMEFGGDPFVALTGWYYIAPVAVYGTAVVGGLMWVQLKLLRFCGWRCIDRRQLKTSGAVTSDINVASGASVSPFDDVDLSGASAHPLDDA